MPWIERICEQCGAKFHITAWKKKELVTHCPDCSYVLATIEGLERLDNRLSEKSQGESHEEHQA